MRIPLRPAAAVLTVLAGVAGLTSLTAAPARADMGPSLPAALAAGMPTSLTLAVDTADVAYGGSSTLTGHLTDPETGSGVAGAQIRLETRAADGSWVEAALLATDGSGSVRSGQAPMATTVYRLRHAEPGAPEASTSPEVTVSVHPASTAALRQDAVQVGRPVTVAGVLAPAAGDVPIRLERRSDGRWARVARTRTAADGSFTISMTPDTPGFWSMRVVPGAGAATVGLPRLDVFRVHHYSVTTRGAIRTDLDVVRDVVAATYADPRGWLRAHHRFVAVTPSSGRADFTVVLSGARYLPTYSSVCSTVYSCRVGRNVIINQDRWRRGSPYFPGTLDHYRAMVINHETGHWLGRGHAFCSGQGRRAPVMQQQSKGMHGCRVNPWPLDREVRAVS